MNEEKTPVNSRRSINSRSSSPPVNNTAMPNQQFTPTIKSNSSTSASSLPIIESSPRGNKNSQSSSSSLSSITSLLSSPSRVTSHLSSSEIRDLHEAFRCFDREGFGFIDTESLKLLMSSLGYSKYNNKLIYSMINSITTPTLSFKDFLSLMESSIITNDSDKTEIDTIFTLFDSNNDGYIDIADLKSLCYSLHETINEKDFLSMIECADLNGDGKINKQEFFQLMTKSNNYDED